eukprot:gene3478-3969_t
MFERQRIRSISAGAIHIAVITDRGLLYSWGEGLMGRLGHGDQESEDYPKRVEGLEDVVAVAAGGKHTLALTAEGAVYTWGANDSGQLGLGPRSEAFAVQPQRIICPTRVAMVAAGTNRSAFIGENGALYTWGRGDHGRLGHGDTLMQDEPRVVLALQGHVVTSIASGGGHSLALTAAGAVFSWGRGECGQLGHGTPQAAQVTPKQVQALTGMRIQMVSSGGYHSLAVEADGTVYSWGRSDYGVLGGGVDNIAFHSTPSPVSISRDIRLSSLSSGFQHNVAMARDGGLYSWGCGASGRLGTRGEDHLYVPTMISPANYKPMLVSGGEIATIVVGIRTQEPVVVLPPTVVVNNGTPETAKPGSLSPPVQENISRSASPTPNISLANDAQQMAAKESLLSAQTSFIGWIETVSRAKRIIALITQPRAATGDLGHHKTMLDSSPIDQLAKEIDERAKEIRGSMDHEQVAGLVEQRNDKIVQLGAQLNQSIEYWTGVRRTKETMLQELSGLLASNKPLEEEEGDGDAEANAPATTAEVQRQCQHLGKRLDHALAHLCASVVGAVDSTNFESVRLSMEALHLLVGETRKYGVRYIGALAHQARHGDSLISSQITQRDALSAQKDAIDGASEALEECERVRKEHRTCKRAIIEASKRIEVLELDDDPSEQASLVALQTQLSALKKDEQRLLARQQVLNDAVYSTIERHAPELKLRISERDKISNRVKDTGLLVIERKLGHYDIIRTLATHPHNVYLAQFDDQDVVLKEFGIGDNLGRQMFERQVSLMKLLSHKCIMRVQAVFYDRNHAFLQMEYVRGGTLAAWLRAADRRPWELQKMFQQVVQGIAYMHSNGVIHRDIKLENILVREDGTPVISDFDLSREVSPNSGVPTTFGGGTSGYRAPEMEAGSSGSYASDIWALGIMLYKAHFPKARDPFLMPGETAIAVPHTDDRRLAALLSVLLQAAPASRPAAHQIAVHPYFVTSLVEDLVNSRTLIDSREKIAAFRAHISSLSAMADETHDPLIMSVRRATLVPDVFTFFRKLESSSLFTHLEVTFVGEPGLDHGGLSSEMYSLLFNQSLVPTSTPIASVFSTDFGLLERGSDSQFHLVSSAPLDMDTSPLSSLRTEHAVFTTLGKIFLKAVIDGKPLPDAFAPSFFKHLLRLTPSLHDLEAFDEMLAHSFRRVLLLDNIDSYLATTFEGLIDGGENIQVTDANKEEFISRNVERVLVGSRRYRLDAFREGFLSIESLNAHFALFSPAELQILVCGNTLVDAALIQRNVKFIGFPSSSNTPAHLLAALGRMSQDELHLFLRFLTGMVVVPMQGLERPLTVVAVPKSDKLPCAHTCSYQLDLPDYDDADLLQKKILQMLEWLDSGFGFV